MCEVHTNVLVETHPFRSVLDFCPNWDSVFNNEN